MTYAEMKSLVGIGIPINGHWIRFWYDENGKFQAERVGDKK